MQPNFMAMTYCTVRYDRRIYHYTDPQQTFPGLCLEAAVIVNTCGREWSFPAYRCIAIVCQDAKDGC